MAIDRQNPSTTGSSAPDCAGAPASAQPPLQRGDLVTLLQRLSVDLDALLDDLGVRREPSGNHESSRRL
jgi:hypothetical protein